MRDTESWFGQPKGLTILFLTEMWEKFSFFGMRALQIYYMTKELHYSQAYSSVIYGTYAAGVYLTPIFGGLIADRWLGRRKAVVIGGVLMAIGHFMMAFPALFFPAMAVIAIGNGLFLPNLPSQVNLLYAKDDPRAGSAFNVYYVGINLGALLAPLICGTLGELYGWHYGFGAAGIGMCLGLVIYIWGGRYLPAAVAAAPGRVEAVQAGRARATSRCWSASRWRSCCSASPTNRPGTPSPSGPTVRCRARPSASRSRSPGSSRSIRCSCSCSAPCWCGCGMPGRRAATPRPRWSA